LRQPSQPFAAQPVVIGARNGEEHASINRGNRVALPLVVGIGGTIGGVSSTERALRIALDAVESEGYRTRMFGGADMARLPLYDPKATSRTPDERAFVDAIREASAVIIASPGYHGSISGVVKNALDLLEETARDEGRAYLADMPVGLIATAYGWQATGMSAR
jgi:FMN reductase